MPKTRRRVRRRAKQVEDYDEIEDPEEALEDDDPEEEPEDDGSDEELEDEPEDDDPEDEPEDDGSDEELEDEKPAPKRSRRKRSPRTIDDDDIDEAPAPKAKATKKKPAKPTAKSPVEPESVKVQKVDDQIAEGVFSELLEAMAEGQAIIAVRLPGNRWQFVTGDAQTTSDGGVKLKGKEFRNEVNTIEFQEFMEEWGDLTYQEKVKKAKKLKVSWEENDDKRVDNIRLMLAVREKLGIEKYKPDYINKSVRDRLKGK